MFTLEELRKKITNDTNIKWQDPSVDPRSINSGLILMTTIQLEQDGLYNLNRLVSFVTHTSSWEKELKVFSSEKPMVILLGWAWVVWDDIE